MRHSILIVEDNGDEELMSRRAIAKADISVDVSVARDGEEACRALFNGAPMPDLVLLDLELPRMSGAEVLERMRAEESTRNVPVVIFSSSGGDADVKRCYGSHANSFVQKPSDAEEYASTVRLMLYYWTSVNLRCS